MDNKKPEEDEELSGLDEPDTTIESFKVKIFYPNQQNPFDTENPESIELPFAYFKRYPESLVHTAIENDLEGVIEDTFLELHMMKVTKDKSGKPNFITTKLMNGLTDILHMFQTCHPNGQPDNTVEIDSERKANNIITQEQINLVKSPHIKDEHILQTPLRRVDIRLLTIDNIISKIYNVYDGKELLFMSFIAAFLNLSLIQRLLMALSVHKIAIKPPTPNEMAKALGMNMTTEEQADQIKIKYPWITNVHEHDDLSPNKPKHGSKKKPIVIKE